jgi:hypothetical protein
MLIISVLSFLHQRQVDERCHIQILLDSFGKRGLCNLGWWVVNGHTHSTYCWSFMVDFRLNLKETIVSNELERLKWTANAFCNFPTDVRLCYFSTVVKWRWGVTCKNKTHAGCASALQ